MTPIQASLSKHVGLSCIKSSGSEINIKILFSATIDQAVISVLALRSSNVFIYQIYHMTRPFIMDTLSIQKNDSRALLLHVSDLYNAQVSSKHISKFFL